jgi:hypothetical protein
MSELQARIITIFSSVIAQVLEGFLSFGSYKGKEEVVVQPTESNTAVEDDAAC